MGLFLRQDDTRSELQSKLAAELQERLKQKPELESKDVDPAFLENQHETRPAGMIIMVLVVLLSIALVVLALRAGGVF